MPRSPATEPVVRVTRRGLGLWARPAGGQGRAARPQPRFPGFSFQIAEQLMTLAYDNGINLFDTAEVYAAGKYVSSPVGKVQPQLPGEGSPTHLPLCPLL